MLNLSDGLGIPKIHASLENTLRIVQRTIAARADDKQRCMESIMFRRALRDSKKSQRKRDWNLRRRLNEKMLKEVAKRQRIKKDLEKKFLEAPQKAPPFAGAIPVAVEGAANRLVPIAPPYDDKGVAVPKKGDFVIQKQTLKEQSKYVAGRKNALNYYRGRFVSDPLYNQYEAQPQVWQAFTDWCSVSGTAEASPDPQHGFCRFKGLQLLNHLNTLADNPKKFLQWVRRGVVAMALSGDMGALPERAPAQPPLPPPPSPPLPAGAPPPEAATPGPPALGEEPLAMAEVTPAKKKVKIGTDLEPGSAPKESTGPAAVAEHSKVLTGV